MAIKSDVKNNEKSIVIDKFKFLAENKKICLVFVSLIHFARLGRLGWYEKDSISFLCPHHLL